MLVLLLWVCNSLAALIPGCSPVVHSTQPLGTSFSSLPFITTCEAPKEVVDALIAQKARANLQVDCVFFFPSPFFIFSFSSLCFFFFSLFCFFFFPCLGFCSLFHWFARCHSVDGVLFSRHQFEHGQNQCRAADHSCWRKRVSWRCVHFPFDTNDFQNDSDIVGLWNTISKLFQRCHLWRCVRDCTSNYQHGSNELCRWSLRCDRSCFQPHQSRN